MNTKLKPAQIITYIKLNRSARRTQWEVSKYSRPPHTTVKCKRQLVDSQITLRLIFFMLTFLRDVEY